MLLQETYDAPNTILISLAQSESITRKIAPYVKAEYFSEPHQRLLFTAIVGYFNEYNKLPPKEVINLELSQTQGSFENVVQDALSLSDFVFAADAKTFIDQASDEWVMKTSEEFCKGQAIYQGILKAMAIIDGSDKKLDRGAIPGILQEALAVTFDPTVGHDFFAEASQRFDFYHHLEKRVSSQLAMLDSVLRGGFAPKACYIFIAGTGVGKSMTMCSLATGMSLAGSNVLYITGEMAEEKIAERIDANMLDVRLDDLMNVQRRTYLDKLRKIKEANVGNIIVKEYPTGSANVNHFRALMNELRVKKNFTPDIVFVDYLNIFCSSRMRLGDSSYGYIKAIAEELRGFAVEYNLPVVTATQVNRAGINAADFDLTEVSESMGVAHTADFIAALISTEQFESMGQLCIKQLKNRFGALDNPRKFMVGLDRAKMRLFDLDDSTYAGPETKQKDADAGGFDKTSFGRREATSNFDKWGF